MGSFTSEIFELGSSQVSSRAAERAVQEKKNRDAVKKQERRIKRIQGAARQREDAQQKVLDAASATPTRRTSAGTTFFGGEPLVSRRRLSI